MTESQKFTRKVYPKGTKEVDDQRVSGQEGTDAETDGLIAKTRKLLNKSTVSVPEVLGFANRVGDESRLEGLRNTIGQRISQESECVIEFTEQQKAIVATLKARFNSQSNLHQGIGWTDVESSLRGNTEAFAALAYMERTGGEPDVLKLEGDEFVFTDTSSESPTGRRNKTHPQAEQEARNNGLELTSEDDYKYLQNLKPVDSNTWSWLGKPSAGRPPLASGDALNGIRYGARVFVGPGNAGDHSVSRGFRCSLRVKKS